MCQANGLRTFESTEGARWRPQVFVVCMCDFSFFGEGRPQLLLRTHRHLLALAQDVQLLLDLSEPLLKPSPRLYILQDPLRWLPAPVALPARLRATTLCTTDMSGSHREQSTRLTCGCASVFGKGCAQLTLGCNSEDFFFLFSFFSEIQIKILPQYI